MWPPLRSEAIFDCTGGKFISDAKNGGSKELSAFELDAGDVRVFEAKTPQEPNLSKVKPKRGEKPCFAYWTKATAEFGKAERSEHCPREVFGEATLWLPKKSEAKKTEPPIFQDDSTGGKFISNAENDGSEELSTFELGLFTK